jgi:hypothetical protein
MGRSAKMKYPPSRGSTLVKWLTTANYGTSSALRRHPSLGFFRVTVVSMRYFDRGAGPFMGRGAWVTRCDVECHSYPERLDEFYVDEAGDEYMYPETRPEVKTYNRRFWSVDEALAYANGRDNGDLAQTTKAVDVDQMKKSGAPE